MSELWDRLHSWRPNLGTAFHFTSQRWKLRNCCSGDLNKRSVLSSELKYKKYVNSKHVRLKIGQIAIRRGRLCFNLLCGGRNLIFYLVNMNRRFSTGATTPAVKSYADHRKNQMTSTPKAEMSINSRTSSQRNESFDFPSIIDKRFVSWYIFFLIRVCLLIHIKEICTT